MSVAPALTELIHTGTLPMPLRVEQYHDMIAGGIIPEGEPYELLDGYVVRKDRSKLGADPLSISHGHAWVVQALAELGRRLGRMGCHMRTQQPVTLPPYNEPEPDAAVVRGTNDDYRKRHPGPKDVLCVIEVADASLRHDRTVKMRIYADSGILQYVLINLPERVIEVYTQPRAGQGRYAQCVTLNPGQSVVFPAAGGRELAIPVRRLLG